jgi:hypothetical protein
MPSEAALGMRLHHMLGRLLLAHKGEPLVDCHFLAQLELGLGALDQGVQGVNLGLGDVERVAMGMGVGRLDTSNAIGWLRVL